MGALICSAIALQSNHKGIQGKFLHTLTIIIVSRSQIAFRNAV